MVFGLALAYGGGAQLLAGMWEFTKGNTFGATAFTSYGAFWISFWWLTAHLDSDKIPAADVGKGLGLYLIAWGIFTAYMTVGATRVNPGRARRVRAVDDHLPPARHRRLSTTDSITKIGGYVGILTAIGGLVRLVHRGLRLHPRPAARGLQRPH